MFAEHSISDYLKGQKFFRIKYVQRIELASEEQVFSSPLLKD